ncbi:hypothetical protein [Vibrio lentus]|uniref:Uncharacterized protein n=1 Tax=Vibrio lentus TaxID=136468 RepID=A0A855IU58_9VIBR|nr:hypothetical protein [Vibrio lentus]PMM61305.1 hypothetical protein BCT50_21020 [Vibrio lentus]
MSQSITKRAKATVKKLKGTAGEAYENHAYNKMIKKYGADTALAILEPELKNAGETKESFKTYLRVKQKVQTGAISPNKVRKNAQEEAKEVMTGEGFEFSEAGTDSM